jgi:hypothetical protein
LINKSNIQFKPPYIVTHKRENNIAAAGNVDENDDDDDCDYVDHIVWLVVIRIHMK